MQNEAAASGPAAALRGARVLVTGADGFIGSHLTEALVAAGAEVIPFVRHKADASPARPRFSHIPLDPGRFTHIEWGDVASADTIGRVRTLEPEYIFHLAAAAYVDHSFRFPLEVFRTNAVGTQQVLEAARGLDSLRRLVVFSSSEIYGPSATGAAMDEAHPLNPTSPYAASKLAADRLAWSYRCTFGIPLVILRPFNCYGPRHTYDVIPRFISMALDGRPLTIYGSGLQARDFTYVSDTVDAAIRCATTPGIEGQVFNAGSGQATTITSLGELIREETGSGVETVWLPPRSAEVSLLLADSTKAARVLGWAPRVGLREGISRNVAWERARRLAHLAP